MTDDSFDDMQSENSKEGAGTPQTDGDGRFAAAADMIRQIEGTGVSLKQISVHSGVNYITLMNIRKKKSSAISVKVFDRLNEFFANWKSGLVTLERQTRGRKPGTKAAVKSKRGQKPAAAPAQTEDPAATISAAEPAAMPARRGRPKNAAEPAMKVAEPARKNVSAARKAADTPKKRGGRPKKAVDPAGATAAPVAASAAVPAARRGRKPGRKPAGGKVADLVAITIDQPFTLPVISDAMISSLKTEIDVLQKKLEYFVELRKIQDKFKGVKF